MRIPVLRPPLHLDSHGRSRFTVSNGLWLTPPPTACETTRRNRLSQEVSHAEAHSSFVAAMVRSCTRAFGAARGRLRIRPTLRRRRRDRSLHARGSTWRESHGGCVGEG